MDNNLLKKYSQLLIKRGINIQKNQTLVIISPIECASFTRLVAKTAYEEGAKDVIVEWIDEQLSKTRFLYSSNDVFERFPEWQKDFYLSYAREGAAFLNIDSKDPELMKDVDTGRISIAGKVRASALKEYAQRKMMGINSWCIAAYPSQAWAKKVFPESSAEEAFKKLLEAILKTSRIDGGNPLNSWDKHKEDLRINTDFLNSSEFKKLHYKNSAGTDLIIWLPEDHMWISGSSHTPEGIEFSANIPTEEIFTMPERKGINGTVVSSKPLGYNGSIINDFYLKLRNGKIVDFGAEQGYETLRDIIETDEGSHYIGEVALVPYNSPISMLNIMFYNTLFDENASCHLAIGEAYPCLKNVKKEEDLLKYEINHSLVHVDFMIGTDDLYITGTTKSGKEIPIFINGNFAGRP